MFTGTKRKAVEDDFVHTLSDNEDNLVDDEVRQPPPKKKVKTQGEKGKGKKKNSKGKDFRSNNSSEGTAPENQDDADGLWGAKDDDDGAMDSDFEFMIGDDNQVDDSFEGWGFDGAKKSMGSEKPGVDIEEIIRRRRETRGGKSKSNGTIAEDAMDEEDDGVGEVIDIDLDDDEDGVLASDAFGMGDVDPDDEDDVDGNDDDDDDGSDDDGDSENDENSHMLDMDGSDNGSEHGGDDDDNEGDSYSDESDQDDDALEESKRQDFFAPEQTTDDKKSKRAVTSFQGLSLSRPILRGLAAVGFVKPTPIQAQTIPIALMGKDVVGGAVTGSGKTAAFVVPILERLLFRPKKIASSRVVILTPTRELAIQCHSVATKLAAFTDIKFALAVGGLSLKMQEAELRLRPDVVIATPGRFIDHVRNSPSFTIDTVEILVLDEADRMLEDGFADELDEIMKTMPKSRQSMLFSATMTSSVDRLIRVGLSKPARIMVDSKKKTVTTLTQEFVRLRPGREAKRMGYLVYLCQKIYTERVIIFFRQKKEAHRARIIFALLNLQCAELHGSMNQIQRIASVEAFRDGKVSYLLATDLASRGLDIKGVDTVINYEAPQSLEIYVHRVGRTARAGRKGTACTIAAEPDRKVVKAAVKAGKAQGAKISSRLIDAAEADKIQSHIDDLADEIEEISYEEKEERQMSHVEMQLKKGENMIEHEAEIKSRPKRTWFESEQDKKTAKESGRAELNGLREALKNKSNGKLSNKDKKKLDAREQRTDTRTWKKGSAERSGKGVIAELKKAKRANSSPGTGPAKGVKKGKTNIKFKGKGKKR